MTLQTHRIVEPKARAAFRWFFAATLVLQVFLVADRSLDWHAAGYPNFSSALSSAPAPALAHDLRQAIEPEVWRRTVRPTPSAQDKAAAYLAALADSLVEREGAIQPVVVSACIESRRTRLFDPRGPPSPLFAA